MVLPGLAELSAAGAAHLMVWIALGLLGLTLLVIIVSTQTQGWGMANWTYPRGKGPTFVGSVENGQFKNGHVENVRDVGLLPWSPPESALMTMAYGGYYAAIVEGSGFFVFSDAVVFALFTTFLLPIWTISFATEGLGGTRGAEPALGIDPADPALGNLPGEICRAIALVSGAQPRRVALICLAGDGPGRLALSVYWPAVLWGTLAFSALFHLLGACLRRPAVLALLYAFFIETIMGNMPGQFKRLSISFYTRCLMFERATRSAFTRIGRTGMPPSAAPPPGLSSPALPPSA